MVTKMQYRDKHKHTPGMTTDIYNSETYHSLCGKKVKLDGRTLQHQYFLGPHDIALGLSTDGFAPFKRHKNTAWPLIIFNYTLPSEICFHINNILPLGVIPGPIKPLDANSFLWLVVQEFFRLGVGVQAFDILSSKLFTLCAHLIIAFSNIPAMSMIMHMKGHNGFSPCRMCEIVGLCIPNSRATTHYVPLNHAGHPQVQAGDVETYDPEHLPLQMHSAFLARAYEVQIAPSNAKAVRLAKKYGIKGVPILSYLPSLTFPVSFPYDFMHLIWENLVKNLVLHWTGSFKGLDDGDKSYSVPKAIWEAIGAATAAAGSSIPSAYGS